MSVLEYLERKGVMQLDKGMSKNEEAYEQWNFDAMIKTQPSEKAKAWFRRKPYDIRKGDAGGQENIKSVSSVTERNTETEEGYSEANR